MEKLGGLKVDNIFFLNINLYIHVYVFHLGPPLPLRLTFHEMVRVGYDLIVLGGISGFHHSDYSDSLYKLSCYNNTCHWESLSQELKTPKKFIVAIPVPDNFISCD